MTTPPLLTLTLTSDGSTLTQVISQSAPAPGSLRTSAGGGSSQFFRNKGAVAGVFLVVGLAAASIVLFIFFWLRRHRRKQRQRDASIAAGLAALGHNRSLIDEDDDNHPPTLPGMEQRNQEALSLSSGGTSGEHDFNPYVGYTYGSSRPYAGVMRPGQPYSSLGYQVAASRDPDSTADQRGHTPELSLGTISSNNPGTTGPATPSPGAAGGHQRTTSITPLITQVPNVPDADQPPSPGSHYSEADDKGALDLSQKEVPDPRLNPALLNRSDSQGGASLGDHVDYTRPLTVS